MLDGNLGTMKDRSQLGSKLVIDDKINEEVGKVVDVECVAEVAADWSAFVHSVDARCEGEKENQNKTGSNLHGLHVTRVFLRCLPAKIY